MKQKFTPARSLSRFSGVLPALIVAAIVGGIGVYSLRSSLAAPLDLLTVKPQIRTNLNNTGISDGKVFIADPSSSRAAPEPMRKACFVSKPTTYCDGEALQAINLARTLENLGPLVLPDNYTKLSAAEQIVLITNAERIARGLPAYAGPDESLNQMAQQGAAANALPKGPTNYSWSSNWAGNVSSPLAADYLWVYDDGPNSNNRTCTTDSSAGCWGHRHNILSPWTGATGAALTSVDGHASMAQIFVKDWQHQL